MQFIDRNPALASANYAKGQILTRLGLRRHHSGATAYSKSVDESIAYIRGVAEDYVRYGAGGEAAVLVGKHILEIGPGDNLGVALMLLALGAKTVTCVDGFAPLADQDKNLVIYRKLRDSMTPEQRDRIRDVLADAGEPILGHRLNAHYSTPIDTADSALTPGTYDIVVSRAVLEHLADVEQGWSAMVRSLKPRGEMWHKVDLRSHKLYDAIHPLYFLTIRESMWRFVSRPDPTINRARMPLFKRLSEQGFASTRLYLTHVLNNPELIPHVERLEAGRDYSDRDVQLVREVKPELAKQYADCSDEDLLVTGIFVISTGSLAGGMS